MPITDYLAVSTLTASYAITASYVLPLTQSLQLSGSIRLTPSSDPDIAGADTTSSYLFVSSSNTALQNDLYIRQDGNLVKWK